MATTANEKRILGVSSAAHFLSHLYELSFPAIALTLQAEMGWSLAEVLRLSFGMYLLYGLGALPMGYLTDRWHARWMLRLSMLGAGAGAVLVALSPGKASLVASLCAVGLAGSIYHPAGMALLSRSVRQRGRALGLNGIFGNLGSATAPFLAGLLAYRFGWRTAYAVLGVLGLACGLASLFAPIEERHVMEADPAAASRRGRTHLGYFAILCAAMLFAGFSYRGVSIVLPAVFRDRSEFLAALLARVQGGDLGALRNLSGATLASITYAAGMLGQMVGGRVADRHDLRWAYLAFHAASLPFLLAAAFAHEGWLLAAACAYVFFALGMQPIENSLVAHFTPARWRSTSYGIKFILNFGVGSTAVYAVAALQAGGSFVPVFLLLSASVVCLCLGVVVLLRRSRGVLVLNHAPQAAVT